MEKLDVFALVDELQEEIAMSPTKGFSKMKSVDEKIVMEIIEDLRKALHDELDFSKRIMNEKEQILKAAQTQADEIRRQAKAEAEEMIKEMPITKAAQERAGKVIDSTKTKAAEIRKSANKYAEDVFEELEAYYKESIELIHENKSRLYGKSQSVNRQE